MAVSAGPCVAGGDLLPHGAEEVRLPGVRGKGLRGAPGPICQSAGDETSEDDSNGGGSRLKYKGEAGESTFH